MKGTSTREPPLSIPMQFDKAIRLALKVKPEGGSKKKRRHRARKTKSAA